eukprot:2926035-Prymnesium_polylepis.1
MCIRDSSRYVPFVSRKVGEGFSSGTVDNAGTAGRRCHSCRKEPTSMPHQGGAFAALRPPGNPSQCPP